MYIMIAVAGKGPSCRYSAQRKAVLAPSLTRWGLGATMRRHVEKRQEAEDRIMPARRFNEGDIDFEAIDADLAKLAAPKLSLRDVLDRLRVRLLEQRAKGVTVTQMHEVLNARGVEIGERSLKVFLDKGELPGRKVAASVAKAALPEPDGDPF